MSRDIVSMQLARGGAVSKRYLDALAEGDSKGVSDEIFKHFRKTGLPFQQYSEREKRRRFSALCALSTAALVHDDVIVSNPCCSGLATSYFPHIADVRCRQFYTPNETFIDDKRLRKILDVTIPAIKSRVSSGQLWSVLGLAQGTARASNFRPSAAKAIYGLYAKDRVVWDMSCGWGGRLLGALATPVKKYIGTDPSTKTFEGLKRLADEIGKWSRTKVELHCCGSETFIPKEPVDLCFTSPPYFDTEKYSDEPTQSYLKYPSREKWVNGFLLTTIKNCHKCLRSDGVLVLNVWPSMEEDTTAVAKRAGFVLDKKLQLALSYMPGRNRKKEGEKQAKWKYEPCFIFRKV